jgi:hypothetical protein
VIERHAGVVESRLLEQILVLYSRQVFPFWVNEVGWLVAASSAAALPDVF